MTDRERDRRAGQSLRDRLAYRPAEVAELLGCSRPQVYRLLNMRGPQGLPHLRLGKEIRIPADALAAYVQRLTTETMQEKTGAA